MALMTVHRTPSVCTTEESITRRGRLQKRESFVFVKGAVLLLEEGARVGPHEDASTRIVGGATNSKQRHLHAMVSLLRPEDTVKLAVCLESTSPARVRYLIIVTTAAHRHESLLLGMDFPNVHSDDCTIGLVLPIWSDTQVYLDGDGGFSVTSAEVTKIFKPVSIQTMWSVLQALHGCCERAVKGAVIPGCGLDWAQHYTQLVESNQQCLNEWRAMTGLESVRKDNKGHSTTRERVEKEIKTQLREIMRTEDLENITSKQVRSALEERLGIDMKNYKEYIDNEMMVTMAQMDKPSKILDYLYLGSEWNAANIEELQKNNVHYILNVTMEIDNFFPESFTYMNVRVYDVESTDLLSHWNSTYMFIDEARKNGKAVLVHCKMGVSRSASTVIAFLMKQQGWTFEEAFSHVRECRPIVQPNDSFLRQLQTYNGILSASKQRHSALWRRRSKSDYQFKAQKQGQPEVAEEEQGDDEQEEEEDEEEESPEEGSSSEDGDGKYVFEDTTMVCDHATQEVVTPVITVHDIDKVTPSPSRSGRMDLFSLMQSIQLDDEERLSDRENTTTQMRSPAQRRRSHNRRGLTHQKAHVDVSPGPSNISKTNQKQEKAEHGASWEQM